MEKKQEQKSSRQDVIVIGVAMGLGAIFFAVLIWFTIFSSPFSVFTEDRYHLSIKYPSNWTVAKGYEGTIVSFVSPKEDALDGFQENLNITAQPLSPKTMTLDDYSKIAIKQMGAVFKTDLQVVQSKPITYAGFPAYLYVVKAATSQGLIIKFLWFIKDERSYTITCAAQNFQLSKYQAKFDEMIQSFSIPAY